MRYARYLTMETKLPSNHLKKILKKIRLALNNKESAEGCSPREECGLQSRSRKLEGVFPGWHIGRDISLTKGKGYRVQ